MRIVMISDHTPIGYAVYPDSNKVSHWTDSSNPEDNSLVRRGEKLVYYDGEL